MSEEKSDELVKKLIKAQGLNNIVFIGSGPGIRKIQNSLIQRKVNSYGSYLVFLEQAVAEISIEGAVILIDPACEESYSEVNYEFRALMSILKKAQNFNVSQFKKQCENHICNTEFSIVNIKNNEKKVVGTINDEVTLNEKLIFPGNNSEYENSQEKLKIQLSIANGTSELYHQGFNPAFAYFYEGARYAVSRSNKLNDFKNFEFSLFPTDCGNMVYDDSWYDSCFSELLPSMGSAYLTSFWPTGAMGGLKSLKKSGLRIPQISPFGVSDELDNSTTYPEYLKLSLSAPDYSLSGLSIVYKSYNWMNMIIFGSDDPTSFEVVNSIISNYQLVGGNIVNPPYLRIFPGNYTRDDYNKYKHFFEFAKNSKCRIFYIFSSVAQYIFEGLYDAGFRKGDFVSFLDFSNYQSIIADDDQKYLKKRKELVEGCLTTNTKEWYGDIGKKLFKELSGIYDDTNYMCITYDTVSIVKNSINHLLNIGEDYEDGELLYKTMRSQKLVGCMGSIYFREYSNSIASVRVSLNQVIFNSTSKKFELVEFVLLDRFSQQTMKYVREPAWSTGEKTHPSNFVDYGVCNFDKRMLRKSKEGIKIVYIVSAILLTFTIISSFIQWKMFNFKLVPIENDNIMSMDDKFYLLYFFVQFFEIMALSPTSGIFESSFKNLNFLFGFDLIRYYNFTYDSFWYFYKILIGISLTFFGLSLIFLFKLQNILDHSYLLSKLNDLARIYLPIIGHIGFLPIISLLFSIFLCEEAIGDKLEDSFIFTDCTTFCYTKKHKNFVVLGSISITFFVVSSSLSRALWETIPNSLNLRTKTFYLSCLSIFQVVLIVLRKCLKSTSESASGYSISILTLLFTLFTFVNKPYNYPVSGIFQITSLCAAAWGVLCSSAFLSTGSHPVWIVLFYLGLIVIIAVGGIASRKVPKVFKSVTDVNISDLIQFQFKKGYDLIKIQGMIAKSNG